MRVNRAVYKKPWWLASAGLALTYAHVAAGSGLAAGRFGGEDGHPTTASPTAIYYNPASLGAGTATQVYLETQLAIWHMSYEHPAAPTDVPEPADAQGANTGTATLTNVAAAPAFAAATRLRPFAFGAAAYIPFGGTARFDKNERFANSGAYPGPYDGVQRWSMISGTTGSLFLTGAAAYSIADLRLSIGVSASLVRSFVQAVVARNVTGDNDVTTESRFFIDLAGWQWSLGFGVLYEPVEGKLWLGASYQSPPKPDQLYGTSKKSLAGSVTSDPTDLTFPLPDVVRLGVRFRPSRRLELRLFGDYTRWSVHSGLCLANAGKPCGVLADGSPAPGTGVLANLPRDWQDAAGVRAGASYRLSDPVEAFAGIGFESNPVPDSTLNVASMVGANVSATLGARFQTFKWLLVSGSYTQVYYVPRDNVGKSKLAEYNPPSRQPDAGGKYSQWIGLVHLGVECTLDFTKPDATVAPRRFKTKQD